MDYRALLPHSLHRHYPASHYYGALGPLRRIGTFGLAVGATCALALRARFSRSGQEPTAAMTPSR